MSKQLRIIKSEPDLIFTLPIALIPILFIILIRKFILFRVGFLHNDRLGHFAGNTEQFICQKKMLDGKSNRKTIDLFYFPRKHSCNDTLAYMWKRKLVLLPRFMLRPICLIFRSFKFLEAFRCGQTANQDRDVFNLLDKYPANLSFTEDEEKMGRQGLLSMGLHENDRFICLNIRDGAYLTNLYSNSTSYHDYRDCNIENFLLAAEELTLRGYYVIRMGAKVERAISSVNPKIIDYACNGMRSDFMDIYLGAKCHFCISTGSGFDNIPIIFRRPVLFTNLIPIGRFSTFVKNCLLIPKHHFSLSLQRNLTLTEIFAHDIGFSLNGDGFSTKGISLVENTPKEINDAVVEMLDLLDGTRNLSLEDEEIQDSFWKLFPINATDIGGNPLHGEIRSRIGRSFLLNNPEWIK